MNVTESIKFDKLKEENEALNSKIRTLKAENKALKEELTELNKDLNWSLKTEEVLNKMFEDKIEENELLKKELAELKQQQLFKEDFKEFDYCINCGDEFSFNRCRNCGWKRIIDLKDNSKYDKLPSKEEK
ncbi:hypothetical protein C6B38_04085 [Spiroplasma sp. ChiS]|uniref:hypothetical protein n=1 Tax=Spiroplasma sp. ChiS TaxID=2099885 RepID=UPI000CF98C89|nr:hypothetical protein [Spiroplasma sp. ChiS]PQP78774.1 hypothetical protein C6B38_04085 [Spiroplasma sp. ChiS]